jgi:hemoglobin-like flavoprotein
MAPDYNLEWRIPDHYADCSYFGQSLLKLMTRRKRWSTKQPQASRKVSLVVQVSGGALARTSSVAPSIKIKSNFRGNRVDTIFRAGLRALLFFLLGHRFSLLFSEMPEIIELPANSDVAMTASANLIEQSFEMAAKRCEDLTPLVYRRLLHEHPETATMFRSEGADLVKGSMLALTIEAMLDFAGERTGHFRLIECEVSSHDAYGTPRELFGKFFGVIADTMREVLGNDWSPSIDAAWRKLLDEIDQVVARTQAETEA